MKLPLIISCAMLSTSVSLMCPAQTVKSDMNNKATHPHGIDLSNMNRKVSPGTDFFRYATEGWNKKHPMPADQSRYGVFNLLIDNNNARIRTIIEDMAKEKSADGSLEQKIGTFYNKAMDLKTLNAQGIQPLLHYIAPIDGIKSRDELTATAARLAHLGITTFFNVGVEADAKNSRMNLVQIYQGGLSLGERDYYLDTDEPTMKVRNAYREFGQKVFAELYPGENETQVKKRMDDVLKVETALAKSFKTNAALRVPEDNYSKISIDTLKSKYPEIKWEQFFSINKFPAFNDVNVGQPDELAEVNRLFKDEDLEALKNYMQFRIAEESLPYLSDKLRTLRFDFFGKIMSGTEKEPETWKRSVELTNDLLGEAIGKIYTQRYFPEEAKKRMEDLVKNLQTALGERIKAQEWMSEETKQKALEKLSTFYVKIGYPDKWRSYDALKVDVSAPLLDLVYSINQFNTDYYIEKNVGKPVDRDEWLMTPQTVNAYYNPATNEICFPAGILQYPFFDMKADDAFNYGAIGVVIGHEMTHGFDDQGRKYDKDGNMKEWWSADDSKRFNERAQVIVDFFSNIKVLPDLNGNGAMTEGENLADHGGLQVSYAAFKNATKNQKPKNEAGLTPDQRFFIAYAGVWAGSIREAEIRKRTKSDPHALGEWRVNGALPHIDAWYKAFHITEKDPMFVPKDKRVTIW
jgi:putative endopeptidase